MPALLPEDCETLYAEALNRGDVEAVVELYEPDAKIRRRTGELVVGADDIREHVKGLLAFQPNVTIERSSLVSSDGTIALTSAQWNMTATGPDGSSFSESGKSIELVRLQADGTWRFVLDSPA